MHVLSCLWSSINYAWSYSVKSHVTEPNIKNIYEVALVPDSLDYRWRLGFAPEPSPSLPSPELTWEGYRFATRESRGVDWDKSNGRRGVDGDIGRSNNGRPPTKEATARSASRPFLRATIKSFTHQFKYNVLICYATQSNSRTNSVWQTWG